MTRVPIPPKMLRWACERAGYDVAHLAARIPQLPAWVRRERQPTLKQLEKLAKATHTPLGYLFLPEPPDERLPVPDYRTVSGLAPLLLNLTAIAGGVGRIKPSSKLWSRSLSIPNTSATLP